MIYPYTVAHRLPLTPEAKSSGKTAQSVLKEILFRTAAPTVK